MMETILKLKDVIHRVAVWFAAGTLPDARKPYIARPETLPCLNVGEVALKAGLYGMSIEPEELVRGVNSYLTLCAYLVADGYTVENALFRTRIRSPGEYDGDETAFPEGLCPEPRIRVSPAFRAYIREHVEVEFKGIDETHGHMFKFLDEASGRDSCLTPGYLLHIRGTGLKIAHDGKPEHVDKAGLWFVRAGDPALRTRAAAIAVNEPRRLIVLIPPGLPVGHEYRIEAVTQSSLKHSAQLLKEMRTVRSGDTFECI
ncbi:MAG: DUF4469 domain-containing protein [Tannerella sp.]|jgi:hypothetical protein|nr:DUF4469 domain-containing protein [Tannerella sp.]